MTANAMLAPATFQFDVLPVRVIERNGEAWFVATDIANALGYRDAANMIRLLDGDEKGTHEVSTPGGPQSVTTITESGLYHAIFKSRSEVAARLLLPFNGFLGARPVRSRPFFVRGVL